MKKKKKKLGVGLLGWSLILLMVILTGAWLMPEKKLKWEMTQSDWVKFDKWVTISKSALSRSDLPAKDVSTRTTNRGTDFR